MISSVEALQTQTLPEIRGEANFTTMRLYELAIDPV
jgi:hypothetical protein